MQKTAKKKGRPPGVIIPGFRAWCAGHWPPGLEVFHKHLAETATGLGFHGTKVPTVETIEGWCGGRSIGSSSLTLLEAVARAREHDPPWAEFLAIRKGPALPEELPNPSQGNDSPPKAPDLSSPENVNLDELSAFLLALQQTIRDDRHFGWTWREFEEAEPRATCKALDRLGYPKWSNSWWQLVRSFEKSRTSRLGYNKDYSLIKNLELTRAEELWYRHRHHLRLEPNGPA